MYQGSIGYFINQDTGEGKWLWKLRKDQYSSFVYYDMADDSWQTYGVDVVTDNGKDVKKKQWVLEHELTPEEMLASIKFTPPPVEHVKREHQYSALMARKLELQRKAEGLGETMKRYKDEIERIGAEAKQVQQSLWNVLCHIDALHDDERDLYVVHGVHHATDTVDFQWYADKALAEKLKPGDIALVNTAKGDCNIIVRSVEKMDKESEFRDHRYVIRKVEQ